jgi:peroxiredoxin
MLEEGDRAPSFELPSTSRAKRSLADLRDRGTVVLVVNRGVWCSYCAEQLQTFSHHEYDLWRNHDTHVVGLTGDSVGANREMQDRFDLSVQLLSDTSLSVAERYTGIEDSQAHGEIPFSGTFVIDPDGVVQYAQHAENPADRTYANYVRHFVAGGYERPYA